MKITNIDIPIIHIIGLPGSGKTSLALRLSRALKIPIIRIGYYRSKNPQTPIGEADAWIALFRQLSRHKWKNCILETTGLNCREHFLRAALPFGVIVTIKLEASRKILEQRIMRKRKHERGGGWLFSTEYRDKFEFVHKLYSSLQKIPANCCINTGRLTKVEVYKRALREIDRAIGDVSIALR